MNIKTYAIVLKNNDISEHGFKNLKESSDYVNNDFVIQRFDAIDHTNVESILSSYNLRWNYPWEGSQYDNETGLKKSAYSTKVKEKRIACSLSHFLLWSKCVDINEPILILEHDSIFIKRFDDINISEYSFIGINDPRGATRKSSLFHQIVQNSKNEYVNVPTIDDLTIPQGLAGNSAYVVHPNGAKTLIELCYKFGLWPNDAIMCQQLVSNMFVTKTYYTKTQGLKSTTTL
jgi:GR25 family glycosyltransferase involved in LPS biosynthesis